MSLTISVIIPTYNAQNYLPKLFESLQNQTVTFELIIIDSSSSDLTVEIAKKYTKEVYVIPKNEFDHGGTRTKAVQIAHGDIIVFLTQDALPYDEYTIQNIVKVFNNVNIGAAYGKQIAYSKTNSFGKHLRIFNYPNNSYVRSKNDILKYGIKTAFLSDSFAAYRKQILKEIGWFKNDLILGEDTYAGAKIILHNFSLAYVSEAKVYHSHSYTLYEEFKRYFDIGVFHKLESWILKEYGKAEGEGIKYIKSEFKYLLKNKKYFLLPQFFIRNALKYLAYKLGQKYEIFPMWILLKLSMHKSWWKRI